MNENRTFKPSFSVIIPVYNRAELVKKAIDAVLAQDYDDYELILVDDGSTDGSGAVCDAYALQYSNIQAIHQINSGLATARNTGMNAAKKDYILFCDDDDYLEPNTFSSLVELIEQYGIVDMIVFGMLTDSGYPIIPTGYEFHKVYDKQCIYEDVLPQALNLVPTEGKDLFPFACNKAYRRASIEKIGQRFIDGLRTWEDKVFWQTFIGDIDSLLVTDQCFYNYKDGAGERLSVTFNFQMLSMMPLKHKITKEKYGERFDFDTQYFADYKANSTVGLIVRFYNSSVCGDVDRLREILSDELFIHWLRKASYKDNFKAQIAECVLHNDYVGLPNAVRKYEKNQLRIEKHRKLKEKVLRILHLPKRILKKVFAILRRNK